MPDLAVESGGGSLAKDFLVILLGAALGAILVYIYDVTLGRFINGALVNATSEAANVAAGVSA